MGSGAPGRIAGMPVELGVTTEVADGVTGA